ncbi:glycoside hydrolase family 18 protein [Pseudochryseolinea flava]|uniref:chitinase n=1 Tax=Pseudochryseolinea flava TaxID=2059302 RepID=A0A364Y0G1_9BACT|nr:glycoside hydrolase family 18 protein [Pseudochryseolinea flava]RAW00274.1 glycoside hydrolase [Pseudochryseolinea flava]
MRIILLTVLTCCACFFAQAQYKKKITVIAYYSGGPEKVDSLAAEKLTHIIFSFCHLKGNELAVDNSRDSVTIKKLVGLKKRNPDLKVILSLGGWGGCAPCSDVFSTSAARTQFAKSVLKLNQYFKSDGIDLDWEYPTIEGHPGHKYQAADKNNFTELVKILKSTLGSKYEVSFAAGGFQKFLEESVDWKAVMPHVDRVNLMTYDLINGFSTETGHHTALYSRPEQKESTDNCIQYLIKIGVPRDKLVLGAAFYGRIWENVPDKNNGLYQPGKFLSFVDYHRFAKEITPAQGYELFWDDVAKAPYGYNATKQHYITFDDKKSMRIKTQYVIDQKLDGIMFWELNSDTMTDGLLEEIDKLAKK